MSLFVELTAMDLNEIRQHLDQHEGCFRWMYLDTVGKVTIGYGTLLATVNDALNIPFIYDPSPPQLGKAKSTAASLFLPTAHAGHIAIGQAVRSGLDAAHQFGIPAGTPMAPSTRPELPRPATRAEIIAEYNALMAGSKLQHAAAKKQKHGAAYYENQTKLRISLQTASDLRDKHLEADFHTLKEIFPKFLQFPKDAKVALFDIIYNTGGGRSRTRQHRATGLQAFMTMNAAINSNPPNWKVAAQASHRHGIGGARNAETNRLFLNCHRFAHPTQPTQPIPIAQRPQPTGTPDHKPG